VEVKYALNEAVEFTPVMTSSLRQSIIEYAQRFIGNPYVWGGTSLTKGADCSGFTMSVFANFGIKLSHSSKAQAGEGKVIDYSQIRPGDLIFYGRSGVSGIGHVAIYIGNGKIVHAASERTGITISSAKFKTILKVVNVIGD
jgi:cell wall-associated NlpC family hydrolase